MPDLYVYWQGWLWPLLVLAGSVIGSLVLHKIAFSGSRRLAESTGSVVNQSLVRHSEGPTQWIFRLLAIMLALPTLPVRSEWIDALRRIVGLGVIAAIAWSVILLTNVLGHVIYAKHRLDEADKWRAMGGPRRKQQRPGPCSRPRIASRSR